MPAARGLGAQRNLASHPRKRAEEHAARVVANAFGDLLDGAAVELAIVNQHFHHIARDRTQDLVSIDLGTNDGFGGDNGGGRTGNDNVIAFVENRVQMRLDIGAFSDNSLDDGSAADLVFDRLNGSASASRHAIGPRLEFAIGEILGLWRGATRKLRLELGRFLLQVHPHELRCDKRDEQEREDIAKHIGDGIAGRDVCLQDCVRAPAARPDAVPGSSENMKAKLRTMMRPVPPSTRASATCARVRTLKEAKNSGPDR